jgi:cellulose synthase/poly-beta-1,6-N-acetylglucosamine synthase-like glycosyltransferase
MESITGNIFAADGYLYAIRRKLYVIIKDPAQSDDIAISTRVVLQGYRLVYEPNAVTYENPPLEGQKEFKRKIRVTNRSLRALLNLKGSLWTSRFYSMQLLSHKFFRHLLPFPLLVLLGSNMAISKHHPVFLILLCCQGFFYGLAIIGYKLRNSPFSRLKPLSIPYYFCLANAAAFLGALSIIRGLQVAMWEPRSGIEKMAVND